MIIDIIVILNFVFFNFIDNGVVHFRYPSPNTETLFYNMDNIYTTRLTLVII